MPEFVRACLRVIQASGHSPAKIYLGLFLRVVERAFSIAPYFLAWYWLLGMPPFAVPQPQSYSWVVPALVLIVLLLGQMAFSYFSQMNSFLGSYDLTLSYRERLINHLRQLPLNVFGRQRVGQLSSVITDDVKRLEDVFTHLTAELLAAVSVPVLFAAGLFWVDWRLALALLITWPLALLALNAANRMFLKLGREKQVAVQETSGLIVELIAGLRTLKLFGRVQEWVDRLDQRFAQIRQVSMGAEAWGGGSVQAYRFVLELGLLLLLLAAGWLTASNDLSPASWLLFVLVSYKVLDPLLDAAAHLVELRAMLQGEARLQHLLDTPVLREGERTDTPRNFSVAYRHVNFAYDSKPVLQDIDFDVPQGTVTAIVGPSGAGKSSLLHLLARFDDPRAGTIYLGDTDLRAWRSDSLYQYLAFVFQDVQLFEGSILENVRIGREGASDEEVIDACHKAGCDSFVQHLAQGYATRIGENGQQLSGGERQRLSIARAILRNAPVLLLDEATASVDSQSQHFIEQALALLAKDRTVLMVAHRLNAVRHVDQILVLDQGRVCEKGTHQQLLEQDGLYAELWRRQDVVGS